MERSRLFLPESMSSTQMVDLISRALPQSCGESWREPLTQLVSRLRNSLQDSTWSEVVSVEVSDSSIVMINRADPLFEAPYPEIEMENLGRGGQRFTISLEPTPQVFEDDAVGITKARAIELNDLTIRSLGPSDARALSRLFYKVYEFRYINESVYYPERLASLLKNGELISIGAETQDGDLVSHVGLYRWSESPHVYEPCMGLTDPTIKVRGLFSKIFGAIFERMSTLDMSYGLFDCVTNLDFSQRLTARYGAIDTALFVGSQSASIQAKLEKFGVGQDLGNNSRYSMLMQILPGRNAPFGEVMSIPASIGERLGFVIDSLGMEWSPSSRFETLSSMGSYERSENAEQESIHFDVADPGVQALQSVLQDWQYLMRNGFSYASVDVPVTARGLRTMHDLLSDQGFFLAGLVPYRYSSCLAVRFQALTPVEIDFGKIAVHSANASKLKQVVEREYLSNRVI